MTLMDDTDVLPVTPPHDDIAIVLPSRRTRSVIDLNATLRRRLRNAPFVIAIGLTVLAMTSAFALWASGVWSEPRQQRLFKKYETTAPLIADGTISDAWPKGVPVALLRIPRFNRSLAVGAGTSRADLRDGPGFSPDSAFPNTDGNAVIVGKSTTYGSPFSDIKRLVAGDQIIVTSPVGTFVYQVASAKEAKTTSEGIYDESETPQLTLITNRGGPRSRDLFVVKADKVLGTVESTEPPPPVAKTKDQGFAAIIVLGIIGLMVGLFSFANGSLARLLSRKAALWLVVPIVASLTIPLMMQLLLLLPRGY
jgi:LPXTG-site transpeptidase (sortase) family protein